MKTAIFAGSFDPITLGHMDILIDSAKMFDRVIIAVSKNINKKYMLSTEDRISLIKTVTKNIPNVEVDSYDCLTVEYAKKKGASILIRGLRNSADYEYETQIAQNNRALNNDITTVFFTTKPEHSFISSNAVREILNFNGDISTLVPEAVVQFF